MDYQDAVAYMDTTINFGIQPGLEQIRALCDILGKPQEQFNSIHIAGTNGKTSTARIVSAILFEHGLNVATYTSPHLISYTERFLINNQPIAEEHFAGSLNEIIPYIEKVNKESVEPLTHFEILTALAFYMFAKKDLDCAVIETGMGGRWDATNIIYPEVAAITNVELEHTDRLGKTIAKIAWEKAHIIKNGSKAVAGDLKKEAFAVVEEKCEEQKVELLSFGNDFALNSAAKVDNRAQMISVKGIYRSYDDIILPLLGEHQGENATLAIAISEACLKKPLSLEKLKTACRKVTSPGRFEIISRNPFIVLDGAHNVSGILRLMHTVDQTGLNRLILVLAILEDKNVDKMLKPLAPKADFIFVTENHSERCLKAEKLAKKIAMFGSNYKVVKDIREALQLAVQCAKQDDLVLVTGSLYTVGESKEFFNEDKPE